MWIDIHNHVIPGVDDGARSVAEAVTAVTRLRDAGVKGIVATPHFDASLTFRSRTLDLRFDPIDEGWERLREALGPANELRMERAVELRFDVPEVDLSDPRLRLGGGRAVLVEFPFMRVPPRSDNVLRSLVDAGWIPVLAHPERYTGLDPELRLAEAWLETGAALQVNAGALLGRYGRRAEAAATGLLGRGWIHCLASDFHAREELPLRKVRELLEAEGGQDAARLLFETNPARLLDGEAPLPVPPVHRPRRLLQRLRALFGVG